MKKVLLNAIAQINQVKSNFGLHLGRWGGPIIGADHFQSGGQLIKQLFPSREMTFDRPLVCDQGIEHRSIYFPEVHLYKHHNATVVASPGGLHAVSENGFLIPGLGLLHEDFFFKTRLRIPKPKSRVDKGFLLESSHSSNYYHWCIDVLPTLGLMPNQQGVKAIALERNQFRKNQFSGIDIRGFGLEFFEKPVLVEEFYSISGLFPIYGAFRPEPVLEYWGDKGSVSSKGRRLYLTRGPKARRRLLNEQAILELLLKLDFEVVDCSELDLKEQREIFHQADLVVGVHGAGLTNLVHCQPGTKVIEIFGPGFQHFFYQFICNVFGLEYHAVHPAPLHFDDPLVAHCGDFELDGAGIHSLLGYLEKSGCRAPSY